MTGCICVVERRKDFLKLSILPDEDRVMERLERLFVKGRNASADQVSLAVKDSYKRLLTPSIETEFFNSSKEEADTEAINVFAENLRQLLLSAPLGQKRVLAVDPGYRTGCKVVCLDAQGNLLQQRNDLSASAAIGSETIEKETLSTGHYL